MIETLHPCLCAQKQLHTALQINIHVEIQNWSGLDKFRERYFSNLESHNMANNNKKCSTKNYIRTLFLSNWQVSVEVCYVWKKILTN